MHCQNNLLTSLKYLPYCHSVYCDGNNIPLIEMRYIFMHNVKEIDTGDYEYDTILNDLINMKTSTPEKIQELQYYINKHNL